jgi:ferredoxin/NAD(P)H-dependent FMN reductase
MDVKKAWAVFFSATGTTSKIVTKIAGVIADKLTIEYEKFDFTLPEARNATRNFSANDLVVFGTPVYAGRVPNILLKYLETIKGNGAAAIPVVLYGNRNYDDALIELRDILERNRFHTIAAAAFIGEHAFSNIIAKGRPDESDMAIASSFANEVVKKLASIDYICTVAPINVNGVPYPYRKYYQPRDSNGNPIDTLKVKPLANADCNDCKICAEICPMSSISYDNVREFRGICIRCGACIKKCPLHARYFEDIGYLYHVHELEETLIRRAEPELFI